MSTPPPVQVDISEGDRARSAAAPKLTFQMSTTDWYDGKAADPSTDPSELEEHVPSRSRGCTFSRMDSDASGVDSVPLSDASVPIPKKPSAMDWFSGQVDEESISLTRGESGMSLVAEGDDDEPGEEVARRTQTSFASAPSSPPGQDTASKGALPAMCKAVWVRFDEWLNHFHALKALADSLGVSCAFFASACIFQVVGFLLFGLGGQFICHMVGALYPAFETYKVIESGEAEHAKFWLTYWAAYGVVSSAETTFYYFVVNLPFYYPMKLGFLLWMNSHKTYGAQLFYNMCVEPFFSHYRNRIDYALAQSKKNVGEAIRHALLRAREISSTTGSQGMGYARRAVSALPRVRHILKGLAVTSVREDSPVIQTHSD